MRSLEEKVACRNRIIKFACEYLKMSQRQWCLSVDLSTTWIKTWGGVLTVQTRAKIEKVYPQLNIDWVLTGDGDMILKDKEGINITNNKVICGNNSGNEAGGDINISVDDSKARAELTLLKAKLEASERQLQEQRELINMLIEKLSAK